MTDFARREIQFAQEASFCVNAATPASNTWTTRIPALSVDSGPPEWDRQSDGSIQSRQNESRPGFLGPKAYTLEFTTLFPGHGGTCAGSLTGTWAKTLLGAGLGGSDVAQVGHAIVSAASATQFSSASTVTVGSIVRVGVKGDTRCDGQSTVVSDATTTLLIALPATASTADTMYATQVVYPTESPSLSFRFLVGFAATGAQYHLMGCKLSGLQFAFPTGGLPTIKWTWACAYWDRAAVTIPSALALEAAEAAPCLGGSVARQNYGTTTRATLSDVAEITLALDMGLAEQPTVSGLASYQRVGGYERARCVPTVSFLLPWSTTYDTEYSTDGPDGTDVQLLVTLNVTDGRSVGFYMPRAYRVGPNDAFVEMNGLLYQRLTYRGREGLSTNDLTKSAIRFFMG